MEQREGGRSGALRLARITSGIVLLSAAVLGAGMATEARAGEDAGAADRQAADGKKVYSTVCAACHQANGEGVPNMFPPLVESEWVTGDKERLVKVLLHGLTGEIEVAGEVYSGMMPPWAGSLKDAEIAAVSTYIRNSWGNKAEAVTAAEVAAIRSANAARKAPWTAKELALSGASRK